MVLSKSANATRTSRAGVMALTLFHCMCQKSAPDKRALEWKSKATLRGPDDKTGCHEKRWHHTIMSRSSSGNFGNNVKQGASNVAFSGSCTSDSGGEELADAGAEEETPA